MKILHRLSYFIIVPVAVLFILLNVAIIYFISLIKWVFTGKWNTETISKKIENLYINQFIELLEKYYPL